MRLFLAMVVILGVTLGACGKSSHSASAAQRGLPVHHPAPYTLFDYLQQLQGCKVVHWPPGVLEKMLRHRSSSGRAVILGHVVYVFVRQDVGCIRIPSGSGDITSEVKISGGDVNMSALGPEAPHGGWYYIAGMRSDSGELFVLGERHVRSRYASDLPY